MSFSLNEVEVTAKKAARGAGYSWGLAEDAGKATRWLQTQGLDGCRSLAALLRVTENRDLTSATPTDCDNKTWQGSTGLLCPLIAGAALSDHCADLTAPEIKLADVMQPLLILPFAATAARLTGACIAVRWTGGEVLTDGKAIAPTGAPAPAMGILTICQSDATPPQSPKHTRATPDPVAWQTLLSFAHRTYAPATEESRLKGAGADMPGTD